MRKELLLIPILFFVIIVSGCTTEDTGNSILCGNNVCDSDESCSSCSSDCGVCVFAIEDLVIKTSDLPAGWEVVKQGLRISGDEAERDTTNSLNYGWKEGYYVELNSGNVLTSIVTVLDYKMKNIVSRFDKNLIVPWFQKRKDFSLDYDKYKGYGIKKTHYELPNLNIGDDSITYRVDYEGISYNEAGQIERSKITNFFVIEFIKSDVYEYIEGIDYELVKQVARTLENKIPMKQAEPKTGENLINVDDISSGSITPDKLDRLYCEQTGANCPTFLDFQFDVVTVTNSKITGSSGEGSLEVNCPTGTKLISCDFNYENIQTSDSIVHSSIIVLPNDSNGCIANWNRGTAINVNNEIIAYCLSLSV
ncbi:MAG: hypothetical protein ABIH55_00640 [Nanoarchaeota archaeon]